MNALIHGFAAGGFDGLQPVIWHAAQDLDHLPISIIAALQLASDRGHCRRKHPVLEWGAIAQSPRFARQNRHIVPWIVDRLAPSEGASVLSDHHAILPDDDTLSIGMHIDWTADCRSQDGILIVVEAHRAGFGYRSRHAVEAIEGAHVGHEMRALGLEHLPNRLAGIFGMAVRLGVGPHLSNSQAFSSSRLLTLSRGVKKRSRTSPTWFST